jgi:hypothetical protein
MNEKAIRSQLSAISYTPGPWRACADGKCSCRQVWSISGDVPVFTGTAGDPAIALVGLAHHKWGDSAEMIYGEIPIEQTEANARLIAAAPDLLEACKAYELLDAKHANCEECDGLDQPEQCEKCFPLADDARLKMRAAIAKAEGRS